MSPSDPPEPPVEHTRSSEKSTLLRLAREDDVRTRKSVVRFIIGVSTGFASAVVVMSIGVSLDQMWLFYLGMGMAVLGILAIRLRF